MGLRVRIQSASGVHGPIDVPPGFLAGNPDPTPLEVVAEFTRRMAEEHAATLGVAVHRLGFRTPLTITVEEVDDGAEAARNGMGC